MRHRRALWATVAALLGVVVWPALALAAGGGHGGEGEASGPTPIPWGDMIEALVNFGIFAFILVYFLRTPVAAFLEKRSDKIANQLDEAAELHRKAEAKLDEYEKRLEAFDRERDQLFENVKREAEGDRVQIVEDAKRHAERVRKDAEIAVAFELKRARQELRERIVDEAVEIARAVIQKRLDKRTQDRLIRDYTDALSQLRSDQPG